MPPGEEREESANYRSSDLIRHRLAANPNLFNGRPRTKNTTWNSNVAPGFVGGLVRLSPLIIELIGRRKAQL